MFFNFPINQAKQQANNTRREHFKESESIAGKISLKILSRENVHTFMYAFSIGRSEVDCTSQLISSQATSELTLFARIVVGKWIDNSHMGKLTVTVV